MSVVCFPALSRLPSLVTPSLAILLGSAMKNPIIINDAASEPSSSASPSPSTDDSTPRISPEISHNLPDTPHAIRKFLDRPRKLLGSCLRRPNSMTDKLKLMQYRATICKPSPISETKELKKEADLLGALWTYRSIKTSMVSTLKLGWGKGLASNPQNDDTIQNKVHVLKPDEFISKTTLTHSGMKSFRKWLRLEYRTRGDLVKMERLLPLPNVVRKALITHLYGCERNRDTTDIESFLGEPNHYIREEWERKHVAKRKIS
ncbi:hypothetical protein C8Q69DRAFT_509427 [Paecilomyces variotii]|uniref:Uncharacterized protein n=1 Tax=Byssochlamys spectabilis TaxID=264951 RepID=A0A443HM12_BYSSP|nr:hypothetical protein C8Q69DRAFT_509427 [Paecilomyces variotii]RWQ92841.1 hypothetical protein C8Q69DRAFT_509427 [Paecilomyces variotii]